MQHVKTNTNLEHLDIRDAEVKVCGVAEDKASRKEKADRKNRFDEHVLGHMYILEAVKEVSCPL